MENHLTKEKSKTPFAAPNSQSPIEKTQPNDIDSSQQTEIICSLKNHFLIAMPSLTDPYFNKSVVYLCEHDEQGAMGFIVNHPVKLTIQELLKNAESIDYEPAPPLIEPVFLGGPLDMDRGFILHSPDENFTQSTALNEQLMMSNSNSILSSLGTESAPTNYMVTLGYSSWDAGQLEDEISKNQWLTISYENDTIFKTPVDKRWSASLKRLGINPSQLSSDIGHA